MSADNAKRWELIQKAEKVASFHKESLSSEVRNALIGGGIGATVGGVSPYVQSMLGAEEDEDDPNSRKAMRRAVLGGLGGAALGGGYSMLNPEEVVADTGSDEGAGDEGAGILGSLGNAALAGVADGAHALIGVAALVQVGCVEAAADRVAAVHRARVAVVARDGRARQA